MTDSTPNAYTTYLKEIELPSRGLLYGDKVPSGIVCVEPMGTAQEKMFAAGRDGSVVINKIFDDCLTSPIPHQELILGDRVWALLNIRAVSRGALYSVGFTCDGCGKRSRMDVKILQFPIRRLPESFDPSVDYPFKVTLPILGNELGIRLLTGQDTDAINRYKKQVARHSPAAAGEAEYVYRLARRISSIDGEKRGVQETMKFVEMVRGLDSQAIQDAINENEVGPTLEFEPKCEICGFTNDPEELPVTTDFFRPVKRRRSVDGDYIRTAVVLDEES